MTLLRLYNRRCNNGPARNGILLRPETDTSDGNLTRSFVPRRIALCPTTLEVREPFLYEQQDTNLMANQMRVLATQDISCVGRCPLTVELPTITTAEAM